MRSHNTRLERLERATRAPGEHLQVFAQTAGAVAAFRAKYGHAPTHTDIWQLVRDAIPVRVDGDVVDNGVLELLADEPIDYRRGLAAIAPRE